MNIKNNIGIIISKKINENLISNILKNNYSLSVYNLLNINFHLKETINIKNLNYFKNIKNFISSLDSPKKIFIISSERLIDKIINNIINYLKSDDIILDLSNSFWKNSIRRSKWLKEFNINYLDIGIEEKKILLNEIKFMPSGNKKIFLKIKNILEDISCKNNKKLSINYLGKNGVGSYIKDIYNSIKNSNIQLISEIYFILKNLFYISNLEISKIFSEWNDSKLNSYLLKNSMHIILKKNNLGEYLINNISDKINNKEIEKFPIQNSLDINEFPNIYYSSLFIKYISSFNKLNRKNLFNYLNKNNIKKYNISKYYINHLEKSLYISTLLSYIQGISQIEKMFTIINCKTKIKKIIQTLNYESIIESKLLEKIVKISNNKNFDYIFLFKYFKNKINIYKNSLKKIISISIKNNLPIVSLNSSLLYLNIISSKELSTKLTKGQNFFSNI